MEYLQITWFVLWGVLWAVYFMLDGFVLGTGILHNFIGKNDNEKKVILNTVGPVWNGNEVWLITAGGATFAAFPTTYALMFSYLYTALLLLLFALIIRGVSIEFRGKSNSPGWQSFWDKGILIGGFLPALLFGVALEIFSKAFPWMPPGITETYSRFLILTDWLRESCSSVFF
jgi:cytochrome bd ubiquinol oxidase subunit II